MKHILEEAVHNLDGMNAEYNFSLYDVNLPLPGTEKHREIYIVRTNKDGTGRLKMIAHQYSFNPAEEEGAAKEAACEWMVFQLVEYALYSYQPMNKF